MPTNQPEDGTLKLSETNPYVLILGVLIPRPVRLFLQAASEDVNVALPQREEKKHLLLLLSMKMRYSR